MAELLPKLLGDDLGSVQDWARRMIAFFEQRVELDTGSATVTSTGGGGLAAGMMVLYPNEPQAQSVYMTANNAPAPHVVEASQEDVAHPAWHAFDNSTATYFATPTYEPTMVLDRIWTTPQMWTSYVVSAPDDPLLVDAMPVEWVLQGSNDEGESWQTLDNREAQELWTAGEAREYFLFSPALYDRYRLRIEANNGNPDKIVVGELLFKRSETPAPDGWTFADGRAVSVTDYASLFEVFGTKYNDGTEGPDQFRLPTSSENVGGFTVKRIIKL